ncbi:MAG: ATP-binding cassette domain-containing protein [Cyclobacteriaceae bacterium]|nr:ATP-binding cassette domain-containing protein [Cyclobacteriaceae bacterium]
MSEELLKAIIRLFAIVAKERITEDERANMKEFIGVHVNQEMTNYYMSIFDSYCQEEDIISNEHIKEDVDDDTLEFLSEWSKILEITKRVNESLTKPQRVVLVIKIIELVYADKHFSDRQSNLIFYIGEALKLSKTDIGLLKMFVMGEEPDDLASETIMIIDESDGDYIKGTYHLVSKNLTGFIAVLRLEDIETYFIKYVGISTLSLNAQPLKSRSISILPAGSTIRGKKIQTIYYSNIVTQFLHSGEKIKVSFVAENISYHFSTGDVGIQKVNIAEEGGKLIGIMGASGSGKSTLMNVLNGTDQPYNGRVLINGVDIYKDSDKVEGITGYVPQDDLLIEELTVFQNLYFAANLCFSHYSGFQLTQLVTKVLKNLGLEDTKNLKVGSVLEKKISGGQRKRLNIGLELLREPTVMFVDEPTSGLSSRDSENIMDLLKELSLRGKMVFVIIHQPSSDIFKMFDTLLILDVGGFQIYYGNPVEALVYFKNIIDAVDKTEGTCPECGNINPEKIFNIIETRIVDEYGRNTAIRKVSSFQWNQYYNKYITVPKVRTVKEKLVSTLNIPNRFKQTAIFATRDVLSKLVDKQYLVVNLLEAPALAFFMAFLVRYHASSSLEGGTKYTFYHNDNIAIYFFMSIIVALFMGLTVSAEEIFRDRKILKREKYLNLSKGSYLASKIAVLFIISAIQTLTFVLIGNAVLEIYGMGFRLWLTLFSTACFANLLGLNISASFKNAVTIYILIPILLIPQLLLSGVVISFDKFNPKVSASDGVPYIGDIMASRWAFEAALVTQFRDNKFNRQFYDIDKKMAKANYKQLYYIPMIETELSYCYNWLNTKDSATHDNYKSSLELLKNELKYELKLIGKDKFPQWNKISIDEFDSSTYVYTRKFLSTLKSYYNIKYNKAEHQKNSLIYSLTDTEQKKQQFLNMGKRYDNDAINDIVTNKGITRRIVKSENTLIQKINPIYYDEFRPSSIIDFRTKFFTSQKPFLGMKIDTYFFNLAVIWSMTIFLFILVYFDGLKLFLSLFNSRKRHK